MQQGHRSSPKRKKTLCGLVGRATRSSSAYTAIQPRHQLWRRRRCTPGVPRRKEGVGQLNDSRMGGTLLAATPSV